MRILLDENFPLALHHQLVQAGYEAEHIILLGQRGLRDAVIRRRLHSEPLLFLTHDGGFLELSSRAPSRVLLSRVSQSRPIRERVELWMRAIQALLVAESPERCFELDDAGRLDPRKHPD